MTSFARKQLYTLLLDILPKGGRGNDEVKQRNFLIDCIERYGYIKKKVFEETPFEDLTGDYIIKNEDPQFEENYLSFENNYSGAGPSVAGTFFIPVNSETERLAELQKRGLSHQETDFLKVSQTIDTALNGVSQDFINLNTETVKRDSLNMYLEIMEFYKNPGIIPEIKSNSKGLKRGYIAMVLYYSLVLNKNGVSKENIVKYFDNGVIASELFEADKFIKLIFQNKKKYSFIFETNVYIKDLCGMRNLLNGSFGPNIVSKIYKVLENTRKSPKDIAAAIYFITSITAAKGGILPEKLKIKDSDITVEYIANYCKVSAKTLSQTKKELVEFYKVNPDLKIELSSFIV